MQLPDLSAAGSLQHVATDGVPLRAGLAGLAAAPALRQVRIMDSALTPGQVDVLRDHPTLEAAVVSPPARLGDERTLGYPHPHDAQWVAFGAGVMALPPPGWGGVYEA